MPCTHFTFPTKNGRVAGFACTRGRRACRFCYTQTSTKLCDFVTGPKGKTCDAPICDKCATSIGPDLDYCPKHKHEAKPPQQNLFEESR